MSWVGKLLKNKKGEPKEKKFLEYTFNRVPTIWTIGGGKGGVGKSLITSNLGISLSLQGNRVLLVDLDLGAANLHTFFGLEVTRGTLTRFLKGSYEGIDDLITKTPVRNVDLIGGVNDSPNVANIGPKGINHLAERLRKASYDYVLLDLGPGTAAKNLDFFLLGDQGILITAPDPTSIENTYRFLKCLFIHKIKAILAETKESALKEALENIFDSHSTGRPRTVTQIFEKVKSVGFGRGNLLEAVMHDTAISLVINPAKRPEDEDVGHSMANACYDYFGCEVRDLGTVKYSEEVVDSIRQREPLVTSRGESEPAILIQRMAGQLARESFGRAKKVENLGG